LARCGIVSSTSEASRKVKEGAVSVEGVKVKGTGTLVSVPTANPFVVKLGRNQVRVKLNL
jgi:hypothetical protein